MFTSERLVPLVCLIAGLLLVGSELLDTFVIENPEGDVVEMIGAAGRHSFALGLLGLVAIGATLTAAIAGSRPAAVAVAVCGLAALALILAVDLPDIGTADLVEDPNRDYVRGRVVAADGFWISLGASFLLTVGGALMASIAPSRGRKPVAETSPSEVKDSLSRADS